MAVYRCSTLQAKRLQHRPFNIQCTCWPCAVENIVILLAEEKKKNNYKIIKEYNFICDQLCEQRTVII